MKLPKIKNKALKIILIVLGILVGLFLLLAVLVSPIAKSYIEKHSVELIGRQITMDKLRVNLFNASVKIEGCHISEQDLKTDFVTFDTLKVAINPFKLISKEVNIRYITLAGPDIKIINMGERFNFSDLLELGDTTETVDTTPSEWAIGIYNINLHDGRFTYTDKGMNSSWALKNIKVAIPGLYFGGQETNAGISLALADGGTLTTDATYDADNDKYGLDLKLDKVALRNAEPFAKDFLNGLSSLAGTLTGHLKINGSLENVTDIDIFGNLSLNNVAVDMQKGRLASLKSLAVSVNRINPYNNVYDFSTVNLKGLETHFDMYADGTTNFSNLTKSTGESQPSDTAYKEEPKNDTAQTVSPAAAPALLLKVGQLDIEGVNFTFNDFTMAEPFSYPVTNIRMKTDNFVLGDKEKALMLLAQLPNAGSLMARWKGGMSLKEDQYLYLSLKNVTLKNFSPYVLHYLAYPVKEGVLSFTTENTIRNSILNGKNKIDIYNLNVEKKRRDLKPEYNIPLRTALYILKDKDDKIQIDLPIKGNIDSPEFSYTKLIFKTLGNLLVKVALSPLNFVANNLGLSQDELSHVDFSLFQRDLTSEQYEKLSRLADVVKADPDMKLNLEQSVDYQRALKELPMFEMKQEYYLSQNPEKQGKPLSTLDITSITEIKDKDRDFRAFAENKLGASLEKGLAARYPADTIDARVRKLMEMRNRQVGHFLVEKMQVPQEQVVIRSVDFNTLKEGKYDSKFSVDIKAADAEGVKEIK